MASVNTTRKNNDDELDLYQTNPAAVELAFRHDVFYGVSSVFDPCDGLGAITNKLEEYGIECWRSDIVKRGDNKLLVESDFLSDDAWLPCADALVMNPPFKMTKEFLDKATENYNRVIMFNRISFLETVPRAQRILSNRWALTDVYIHAARTGCKKGVDASQSNAVMYAWYVFDKYSQKVNPRAPQMHWLI